MTKQSDTTTQDTTTTNEPAVVKGHLLTDQQMTDWGNDTTLLEPALVDEQGNKRRDDTDNTEDNTDTTDKTADDALELVTTDVTTELEDPGDFTPSDNSFEVTIYTGEEGKEKPKTVKITSVDDAEKLLEDDPNFGSAKNLLDFNRKVTKMETKLENEQAEHDKRKEAYDKQVETVEQNNQRVEAIANELTYLTSKGKLPKMDDKYITANWNDPEIAKKDGVREQIALIKYMNKENLERRKLGLSSMGAIDAYNAMQSEAIDKQRSTVKTDAAQERKTAGARVAGTSTAPVSTAPRGISVGRGGSLRELGQSQWN